MCSTSKEKRKYKSFQDDKKNKWLKNINKTCAIRI